MPPVDLLTSLPPLWRWSTKWAYFIGLAGLIGTTLTHVFVVRPALRRHAEPEERERGSRTMQRLIGGASLLMLVVLAPQNASGAARSLKIGFGQGFGWHNQVDRYLFAAPKKDAWLGAGIPTVIQLAIVLALALALAPLLWRRPSPGVDRLVSVAAPFTVLATLVKAIPVGGDDLHADDLVSTIFTQVHIVAGCTWAGGLITLFALTRPRHGIRQAVVDTWADIWTRFGVLALVSVGAVTLSGAFMAWEHVGSLSQFVTTTYGIVLTCKLVLVCLLVVAGAINQFVLMPRIARLRAAGNTAGAFHVALHHFGRVVAAESGIVVVVVVAAALLSGSARTQAGQSGDTAITGQIVGLGVGILLALVALLWATARVSDRLAARGGSQLPRHAATPASTAVEN